MPIEFKNRVGNIYYIKDKKTKKNNTTYYLTKKLDNDCLDYLPDGFEVFEKYNSGMMFIRKTSLVQFTLNEINIINQELKKNTSIFDYKLDVYGNEIKIYISEKSDYERLNQSDYGILKLLAESNAFLRFDEVMRIKVITEEDQKQYEFMRYCYRSYIDNWIVIDTGENLENMSKKYLIHLGKESYYELF
ncbi:MAG: hypothetical protein HY738_05780 [Bacteroidia bacterium]|nr:hypothetical protein [Bacteroidia bacterium]